MIVRIILAVVLGGGIGLGIGLVGSSLGGQCPILCNPYVSTGLGVVVGLILAAGSTPALASLAGPNVRVLATDEDYERVTSDPGSVVLVEFYTDRCPACRRQMRALNDLADRFTGRAVVAMANAGELRVAAKREDVRAVPTLLIFSRGNLAERIEGLTDEAALADLIGKLLAETPAGAGQAGAPEATG